MTGRPTIDPRMAARRRSVQETRAHRNLRRLLVMVAVAGLIGFGAWLVRSPMFDVDQITVSGANHVEVDAALGRAGVSVGVPVIDVDTEKAIDQLDRDPWVAEASVTRSWTGEVTVVIKEHVPAALVKTSDGTASVAFDGTVLDTDGVAAQGFPVLVVADRTTADLATDNDVRDALAFTAELSPQLHSVSSLELVGDQMSGTVGDIRIRIGRPEDAVSKAHSLMAVLDTGPAPGSVITVFSAARPAVLPPGLASDVGVEEPTETTEP